MPTQLTSLALASLLLLTLPASAQKLDNYGDPLPPRAVLRLGSTRLMTSGGFTWLPDGKTLVTARDGKLLFWEMPSGKLVRELKTPLVQPEGMFFRYSLACSADGKQLVCGGRSGQFCVCDLETGKFVSSPIPKQDGDYRLESIALSPRGDVVAVVDEVNGQLNLWNAATCELRGRVELPKRADGIIAPLFSRDGKTLGLVGRGNSVLLVAVDGSRPPEVIAPVHDLRVHSLEFSADGQRLMTAGTGPAKDAHDQDWGIGPSQIRVWDVATKKKLRELPVPGEPSNCCRITVTPDDKTLVSFHGERALVWDLAKEATVRALNEPRIETSRMKLRVDPQGKYVAAAEMNGEFVRVWDLATGKPLLSPERRHSSYVTAAAFSPDGKTIVTGGSDRKVRLWNAERGEHLRTIGNANTSIGGLAFHEDGRRLLVSGTFREPASTEFTGMLADYDIATGKSLFETELDARGSSLSLSPSGKVLAVTTRNSGPGVGIGVPAVTLALYDPKTGQQIVKVPGASFSGFENKIGDFHWSADGKTLLAACEDNCVRRIEIATGKVLEKIDVTHTPRDPGFTKTWVQSALFLSGEQVVTGSIMDSQLICWNLLTGAKLWAVQPPQVSMRVLAGSPDRKLLACTSTIGRDPYYTHLSLWDVATQKQLADVELGQEDVYTMTFSPDGKRLLLGFTDATALVYEVAGLK